MKIKSGSSKKSKAKSKSNKAESVKMQPSKEMSIRVEQIENGFLVTKEGNEANGWKSVKSFSETNPLEGV